MTLENNKDSFIIEISSDNINSDSFNANKLRKMLDTGRQHEVEELYWQLAGADMSGHEINLIGMMVDESEVNYQPPSLSIRLVRKK